MIGLKIRNENDELTIDDSYKGYSVIQSGSVTIGNSAITVNFSQVITSIDQPIIAIQRWPYTGLYIYVMQLVGEPGNWTGFYTRAERNTTLFPNSPSSALFQYRVYAPGIRSENSYGLRVLAQNGDVVIDSGRKQLRFESSFTGSPAEYPLVASIQGSFQREQINAISNTLLKPSDWIPLSLVNNNQFVENRVVGPGFDVTGPMAVSTSVICLNNSGNLAWNDPDMLGIYIYMEDLNGRTPQNYVIPLVTFCCIIEN